MDVYCTVHSAYFDHVVQYLYCILSVPVETKSRNFSELSVSLLLVEVKLFVWVVRHVRLRVRVALGGCPNQSAGR